MIYLQKYSKYPSQIHKSARSARLQISKKVHYVFSCQIHFRFLSYGPAADPGFPEGEVGSADPVGGCQGPMRRLRGKLACNERIKESGRLGGCAPGGPWIRQCGPIFLLFMSLKNSDL